MRYAIIENGGKQYKAVEGGMIEIDHLQAEVGENILLERVLLISDDDEIKVGTPHINGAKVKTTVAEQVNAPKIVVFKYKPKIRYRVKSGHRQRYTRLKIDKIITEEEGSHGTQKRRRVQPKRTG